ncbi:MAG: L-serine dehydratase [Planctomycetota bacterium]|jgi:L-serine dehydratase
MKSISVFDIIKVGIGPSSSHTMGPWKAAEMFLNFLDKDLELVEILDIYLYGSLAKTGKGHGTDFAVLLGFSGEDYTLIDPSTIHSKIETITNTNTLLLNGKHEVPFNLAENLHFLKKETLEFHPNGMRFKVTLSDGREIEKKYFSVGGGFVVDGIENTDQVLLKTKYPCHSGQDIIDNCKRLNLKVPELVMLNELAWRTEDEIKKHALVIWEEIKACVFRGTKRKGVLPGGLNVRRRAFDWNKKLLDGNSYTTFEGWIEAIQKGKQDFTTVNKWISIFALSVNEENASLGRIVTAPTNGASGVIPAVLMYAYNFIPNVDEEAIIDFILTAGEIGTLYKKKATISAAMGGCQAEIGVSSSMAAGALAHLLGGNTQQIMQAAEIAMEHHLGMTCDPIGGLVQIPCIERNSMGAIKAITAANIAVEDNTNTAKISLDDVIKSMWETAQDMNNKYKETSEGGLAKISVNIPEC